MKKKHKRKHAHALKNRDPVPVEHSNNHFMSGARFVVSCILSRFLVNTPHSIETVHETILPPELGTSGLAPFGRTKRRDSLAPLKGKH